MRFVSKVPLLKVHSRRSADPCDDNFQFFERFCYWLSPLRVPDKMSPALATRRILHPMPAPVCWPPFPLLKGSPPCCHSQQSCFYQTRGRSETLPTTPKCLSRSKTSGCSPCLPGKTNTLQEWGWGKPDTHC